MNSKMHGVLGQGAQNYTLANRRIAPCHVVDVIGGGEDPILVTTAPAGTLIVIRKDLVDVGAGDFEKQDAEHYCVNSAILLASLARDGLIVPRAFTEALKSGSLGEPSAWRATFSDVMALAERRYTVRWRLASEDADTANSETVGTVGEAFEILGNEGAMQAREGNAGSIWLGCVELYSTRVNGVRSARVSSYAGPTHLTATGRLLEMIEAYECGMRDAAEGSASIPQMAAPSDPPGCDLLDEHAKGVKDDWKYAVWNGDTMLGYCEWARHRHHR